MRCVSNMWKNISWQVKLHEPLIEQVQELQSALSADGFHCRVDGCDRSYIHHSARVKYVQYISKQPIN